MQIPGLLCLRHFVFFFLTTLSRKRFGLIIGFSSVRWRLAIRSSTPKGRNMCPRVKLSAYRQEMCMDKTSTQKSLKSHRSRFILIKQRQRFFNQVYPPDSVFYLFYFFIQPVVSRFFKIIIIVFFTTIAKKKRIKKTT